MTETTIYLVVANTNGISYNLQAFFSEAKANNYAKQQTIANDGRTYSIQPLPLIGD